MHNDHLPLKQLFASWLFPLKTVVCIMITSLEYNCMYHGSLPWIQLSSYVHVLILTWTNHSLVVKLEMNSFCLIFYCTVQNITLQGNFSNAFYLSFWEMMVLFQFGQWIRIRMKEPNCEHCIVYTCILRYKIRNWSLPENSSLNYHTVYSVQEGSGSASNGHLLKDWLWVAVT